MIKNIKKKRKKVFKTIAKNLKRRTPIVDERLIFHKKCQYLAGLNLVLMFAIDHVCFVQNLIP